MTVTPAYGRDYKSLKAAREDWDAGKDFIIADMSSRWDGKPTSKRDYVGKRVMVRYAELRKIGVLQEK